MDKTIAKLTLLLQVNYLLIQIFNNINYSYFPFELIYYTVEQM